MLCVNVDFRPAAGGEEQGSQSEVSYYSYEYDSDSEPFPAEPDAHFLLPAETQTPMASQTLSLDTKDSPERW